MTYDLLTYFAALLQMTINDIMTNDAALLQMTINDPLYIGHWKLEIFVLILFLILFLFLIPPILHDQDYDIVWLQQDVRFL